MAASVSNNTVVSISAKEKTAYNRAVAACMDYANQPNPIIVDMSDLGLSAKQAENVWTMIHANGELFWINCYGDTYTTDTFTLPCYYKDARINKMRAKLDAAVEKAFKRIGPEMNAATKVHMLHDYMIDKVDYKSKEKTAYTALVNGEADCFGYTLGMDVLLRRAGFNVDVAFNNSLDHAWNLVKVNGKWYHVDVTWDHGYTGLDPNPGGAFSWRSRHCHLYLLQSDVSMDDVTTDPTSGQYIKAHSGWTCHHECTSQKYDFSKDLNEGFYKHCKDYKSIVRTFESDNLNYDVVASKKVVLSSTATKAKQKASVLEIPATVSYNGATYKVVGIAEGALSSAKAVKLKVASPSFAKSRVANSLTGSKVKVVKLVGDAKSQASSYASYFTKENCGKKVKVK